MRLITASAGRYPRKAGIWQSGAAEACEEAMASRSPVRIRPLLQLPVVRAGTYLTRALSDDGGALAQRKSRGANDMILLK